MYFLSDVKHVQRMNLTTAKVASVEKQQHDGNTTAPRGNVATSPSSPTTTTPSPQPSSLSSQQVERKKPSHGARKHLLVSAEVARSAMLWSTAGVKGAVVALTLGIVVTVLTLVYIGCHYRHQRRISRRHRHLSPGSNDADYLVNGMYL